MAIIWTQSFYECVLSQEGPELLAELTPNASELSQHPCFSTRSIRQLVAKPLASLLAGMRSLLRLVWGSPPPPAPFLLSTQACDASNASRFRHLISIPACLLPHPHASQVSKAAVAMELVGD
ncbi:hypothetical protein NN561_000843 [Cricetulus griseus]